MSLLPSVPSSSQHVACLIQMVWSTRLDLAKMWRRRTIFGSDDSVSEYGCGGLAPDRGVSYWWDYELWFFCQLRSPELQYLSRQPRLHDTQDRVTGLFRWSGTTIQHCEIHVCHGTYQCRTVLCSLDAVSKHALRCLLYIARMYVV